MTLRSHLAVCSVASLMLFATASRSFAGGILFVDDDAPPGGDGLSWETAYRFLQDALAIASQGGISDVLVAQGTYKPDQDEKNPKGSGDFTLEFNLPGGVSLLGGYAGIGRDNPDDRDFDAYETRLSGDLLGNDVPENGPGGRSIADNSVHVIVVEQNSDAVVVEGFTLVGGNARFGDANEGGGIENHRGDSTISHCKFIRNYAARGGGVSNREGSASINDCVFVENFSLEGGGVYTTQDSMLNCVNSDFVDNGGGVGGGVMAENESTVCIADCVFVGNSGNRGAGMDLRNSLTTVSRCLFENNVAGSQIGGGIRSRSGFLELYDCDFIGNCASIGGSGLHCFGGGPIIVRCNFIGNIDDGSPTDGVGAKLEVATAVIESCVFADHHGGREGVGLYVQGNIHKITNCIFVGNSGTGNGAGMNIVANTAEITNCLFVGNIAKEEGGGLFVNKPGVTITAATFTGNHSDLAGGGIYLGSPQGGLTITNSIVYGNSGGQIDATGLDPAISFSCVEGGFEGPGNIDADPLFVDPETGDYRLSSGSPCSDAGHNWGVPVDVNDYDEDGITNELFPVDLEGNPRFNTDENDIDPGCGVPVVVDMGAYEYQFDPVENVIFADINGDGSVGAADLLGVLADWGACPEGCCLADLDLDGLVGAADLLILLVNWG